MTYQLANGATVTLANHTLDEWREVMVTWQLALGCSAAFVARTRAYYTEAA